MRRSLLAAIVLAVGLWHAYGLWQRYGPIDAAAAIERLRGGAIDGDERRRCLQALRDAPASDPRARVLGLAAAIALDDRDTLQRRLAAPVSEHALLTGQGTAWPASEEGARTLAAEAAFGEHWLRHLLFGQWLRARGDPRAETELQDAERGAGRSGARLGGELAAAARAALPRVGR